MGIDPGTANLGFGVIRIEGGHMVALDGGVIETSSSTPIEERLAHPFFARRAASWHRPGALAIEDLFFGKNIGSAISVGPRPPASPCWRPPGRTSPASPTRPRPSSRRSARFRQRGQRLEVQKMVATRLNLSRPPRPDHAADALAGDLRRHRRPPGCHSRSVSVPGRRDLQVAS